MHALISTSLIQPFIVRASLAVVVALQIPSVAAHAPGEPDKSPSVDAPTEPIGPETDDRMTLPIGRLAPHVGFDDDASYLQSVTERVADLATQADRAADAETEVVLLLSAANQLLGYQLEPACSRKLLGLSPADPARETELVRQTIDRIDQLIERAKRRLQQQSTEDAKTPPSWVQPTTQRISALEGFAGALRVYLLPIDGEAPEGVIRKAASRLSELREDQRPAVSAAATFWQACLRAMGDDPKRALPLLDAAWSKPSTESLPYSFFGRLLRCRLVADGEGEASALALLMQIEDQCEDWIEDEGDRQNAVRAAQFTGARILIAWHDRLDASERADERAWCRKRLKKIAEEAFPTDGNTILRLTPAVPMIAQVTQAEEKPEKVDPSGG